MHTKSAWNLARRLGLAPLGVKRLLATIAMIAVAICALALLVSAHADAGIIKGSMFSAANGHLVDYRVYTPPGYSAKQATRYPVVFSLHGKNGSPSQRSRTYAPTLDEKILSGEMMPMIWVFPDGQTNSFYGDSFDGHKQVYSNIVEELVPLIDSTFKTIGDRANRAVEGFSMGGFGAGLLAATNPELFSATLIHGGVLPNWPDMLRKEPEIALEMYNMTEANWLPYSVYDATRANAAAIDSMVNYKMIAGDADGHIRGMLRFRDHLISLGIDPQFEMIPGVSHLGGLYLRDGTGLRFLNDHFSGQGSATLSAQFSTTYLRPVATTAVAVPEPGTWGFGSLAWLLCVIRARKLETRGGRRAA